MSRGDLLQALVVGIGLALKCVGQGAHSRCLTHGLWLASSGFRIVCPRLSRMEEVRSLNGSCAVAAACQIWRHVGQRSSRDTGEAAAAMVMLDAGGSAFCLARACAAGGF